MLHVERFCILIRCIIPTELQRFELLSSLTVTVLRVCVCVSVSSFLPPRASISRNIGTYVFTATRKTLYIVL